MAGKKITVVIAQSQGKNPAKRQLEEEIAAALIMDPEVDVSLVPHLYDMAHDHTGMLFLRSLPGDFIVLAWLYPRATHWTLDRAGVKGQFGVTLIKSEDADEENEPETDETDENPEPHGIGSLDVPQRKIYCIDLATHSDPHAYLDEIRRIAGENSVQTVNLLQWIGGAPQPAQLERYLHPNPLPASSRPNGSEHSTGTAEPKSNGQPAAKPNGEPGHTVGHSVQEFADPVKRRWYPVIDYSRCTNCMECIDFCLFGVYGVDALDRILVEQQDNCKKGCPACSRVCPENAIIFPGHKTPAIAGADGEVAGLKIDLSKLFGGGLSALELAAQERDTELVRDGREAVGLTVGVPKRQSEKPQQPRDELDELMDGLDELNL
jgi:NAD-dependent dihydropyrimidine dehydrogenase PreA subunit